MDYFQGVVIEYLRADRTTFVNTECLLQLEPGEYLAKGKHWYCDVVAVNFRESKVFLCEISYSSTLHPLLKRLTSWAESWPLLCAAVARDCGVPSTWEVRPWLFVPDDRLDALQKKLALLPTSEASGTRMPEPKIKSLEQVAPWKYRSWNGKSYDPDADA